MEIDTFVKMADEYCKRYDDDCKGCRWGGMDIFCLKIVSSRVKLMAKQLAKENPCLAKTPSPKGECSKNPFDLNLLKPVRPHLLKNGKIDYDTQILHIMGECQEAQEALEKWRNDPTEKKRKHFNEEKGDIAVCALTLLVNSTTPEEFRSIAEFTAAKNKYRDYGEADKGGELI